MASRSHLDPSTSFQPVDGSVQPPDSGYGARTSVPPSSTTDLLRLDTRTIHFSLNAWVLVLAILGILPSLPVQLQYRAFRLSMLGTVCSSIYSLLAIYRVPQVLTLASIRAWFQTVMGTKDFLNFMFSLLFATSKVHYKSALVPVICRAAEHAARFLRRNFTHTSLLYRRYLEQTCVIVEANTTALSFMSTNSEILLGFILITSFFSWQRSVPHIFIYWQLLKLMYYSPATGPFHQSVWAKIGRTFYPQIRRCTPLGPSLVKLISAIMMWWFR